jgi:predicted  nucleic acid-binding Zn-ribbon protein
MENIDRLIYQSLTARKSCAAADDDWIKLLESMRDDALRVAADLQTKQRFADTEIARLRSQIEELKREHANAERELALVRAKIEQERKEIGRERANLLKTIDNAFTPAA